MHPTTTVPTATGPMMANTGHTNTLAIVSIICGFGSFFAHIIPGIGGITVAVIAIITGFMARKQIQQTGETGMALAITGIVVGFIHLALIALGIIFIVFVFLFLGGLAFFTATRSG